MRLLDDLARELLVVEVRVARRVGLQLRAVDRDHADLRQPAARAQRQHLAEQPRDRVLVALDKPRERRVIGRCCAASTRNATSSSHARSITREDRIPRA